jgi:hypothetical protein
MKIEDAPDPGTDPATESARAGSARQRSDLEDLCRWQDSGGLWRVTARTANSLEITLLTCSTGEEMARLVTHDPEVLAFVGPRWSNEQEKAREDPAGSPR